MRNFIKKLTFSLVATSLIAGLALAVSSTDKTSNVARDFQDKRLKKAGEIELKQQATGTTATVGYNNLFFKSNGLPYFKDSNGMETPLVAGMGAQWIGRVNTIAASNCYWQASVSGLPNTPVSFSEDTDCNTAVASGSVSAPSTKIPAVVIPVDDTNARYYIVANGAFRHFELSDGCAYRFTDGTDSSPWVTAGSLLASNSIISSMSFSSKGSKTVALQTKGESGSGSCAIQANLSARDFGIDVYKIGGTGSPGAVLNEWQDYSSHFTSNVQGWSSLSGVDVEFRRVGDSVHVRGRFTAGGSSAVEARLPLPSGLTIDSTKNASIRLAGIFDRNVTSTAGARVSSEAGVSYVVVTTPASAGFETKTTGSYWGAGTFSFDAVVPVSGWTGGFTGGGAMSMVRVSGGNGYGSTNTMIRRFDTVIETVGSDITYADSATLGATFTVNVSGTYSIHYSDGADLNNNQYFGISKNSSQLSTSFTSITDADQLAVGWYPSTVGATSTTVYLNAGDVIRAHGDGSKADANGGLCRFTITRLE